MTATMMSWTSAYAQTTAEYEAALAAIQDGCAYRIKTDVSGTTYYLKADGTLTNQVAAATVFKFSKVAGDAYGYGFYIDGGMDDGVTNVGSRFTNPNGTYNTALTLGKLTITNGNRNTWEAQVFFKNGDKYAVRATNANGGGSEGQWSYVAGTFWTVNSGPKAEYSTQVQYIWELEYMYDAAAVTEHENAAYTNTIKEWPKTIQTTAGLVMDASKYTSNAVQSNEGSLAGLLDDDKGSYFHSCWSNGPNADHYLQAELEEPTQNFRFYFIKRDPINNGNTNNRPTKIVISASNDGTNFTDIKTITSIADGLPTSVPPVSYLSDEIDLGAAYKYVRYTVTETNNNGKNNGHVFFTFSEFYMWPSTPEIEAAATLIKQGIYTRDITTINDVNTALTNSKVNVTYKVNYNGSIVAEKQIERLAGTAPVLPSELQRDFVIYETDVDVISAANNVIIYNGTWDESVFKISTDYDNAQWQNMAMRGDWYVTTDSLRDGAYATVEKNAIGLGYDAYQWAFVGDPYNGFKVLNKAQAGKSLAYTDEDKVNQGIPLFRPEEEGTHIWRIGASTSGVGRFFLNVPGTNLYINQFGGKGGTVRFWNSTNNVSDGGSSFTVFDIPTDFSPFVADEIAPYFETTAKYFVFSDEVKTEIGYNPAYKTECPYEVYKSMREKMTDTFLADLSNYVLPETGYYILKNKYYGTYMGISVSDGELWGNYTSASEAKHIVKLTKTGDDTYTLGMMVKFAPQSVAQSTQVIADETAGTYTLVIPAVGYGAFQADPSNNMSVLHRAGGGDIVGWEAPSAASQWEAIDATSIPFTIDESGYATAYMPFPFEVGEVIPEALPTPVGSWAFDDPENPLASTGTATLTPAIHGTNGDPNEGTKWLETKESLEEANISLLEEGGLYVPKGSSLLMNTNNGATGFDKYTVMFDIKKDDMSGYTPLWQNSMADDKDGSLFIKNGQMGLGGSLGYNGNFSAGQWYRVVLVIDTPNKAALYVDGQLLSSCEHTDSYNKHWLLNGPGAVFFADEDGEEHDIKVRGLRFWDVPFTEDQVVRLGTIEGEGSLTSTVPEAFGNWTFEGGTVNGTGTATMTASSGVVANEDGSITVDESNRLEMTTNAADNMNTYTLMMDVKFPDVARYTALIQTDLNNADDAGLFVHNGQIGINAAGLYYHGTLVNDTWYRIVFVVDDLYGSVYVDGVRVSKSSAQLEKWGISTGLFLFEDEDDDNDEGIATVMNIRFWNEALNPAQIAALATVGTEPNLKAFTGKIHDEWITLNEVSGTVPAREGVILKAAPGTYYLNIINDDIADYGDSFDENDLKGTLEPIPAAGKFILAQPEGKEIGFYKATTGNIAATKAYLQIENTSDIKGYIFKYNDDATAIKDINDFNDVRIIKQNDAIYNLAGQRLQKVQKGINIINGKKVLY